MSCNNSLTLDVAHYYHKSRQNFDDTLPFLTRTPDLGQGENPPPKLPICDQIELARCLQKRESLQCNVLEIKEKLGLLQTNLGKVKAEIELLSMEQDVLQGVIDAAAEDVVKQATVSDEKIQKHQRLMELITNEEKLLNDLEKTRRLLSTAHLDQQAFALEMDDWIDEIYRIHSDRKDYNYQQRMDREMLIDRNSKLARQRRVQECMDAINMYCEAKEMAAKPKPKIGKDKIARLRQFHKNTLDVIAAEKAAAAAEFDARNIKQLTNLTKLKADLDEQRENITAANANRHQRKEEIRAIGGDPELLERIRAHKIAAMNEEKERQRLVAKIQSIDEADTRKLRLHERLEAFWTAKANEKRRIARLNTKRFVAIEGDSNKLPQLVQPVSTIQHKLSLAPSTAPSQDKLSNDSETKVLLESSSEHKLPDHSLLQGHQCPFQFHPEEIIFKDFDIGKSYRRKVVATNRTHERLRFFLKEVVSVGNPAILVRPTSPKSTVPDVDTVTVAFESSGAVIPGLTHEFWVTFTPKTMNDGTWEVRFDSALGYFNLSVKSLRKRFLPKLPQTRILFHEVIVTLTGTAKVKLSNLGALSGEIINIQPVGDRLRGHSARSHHDLHQLHSRSSTPNPSDESKAGSKFRLGSQKNSAMTRAWVVAHQSDRSKKRSKYRLSEMDEEEESRELKSRSRHDLKRSRFHTEEGFPIFAIRIEEGHSKRLLANSELILTATFHPFIPGMYSEEWEINFDDPDIAPLKLHLEGIGVDNPFIVLPLNTNFRICTLNMVYQQPIEIWNKSPGSGKIVAKVPAVLKGFVEVIPKSAITHANPNRTAVPILFTVKFTPRSQLLDFSRESEVYDPETRILDFPIMFSLEGFHIPVPSPLTITFQALLDNPEIEITPKLIEFGICSTMETVRKKLELHSRSSAIQHFAFIDLPEWIQVQPNNGFGALLPGELRMLDLLVSLLPGMVGNHEATVKIRTIEKKEYSIHVKVIGKVPVYSLTYSRIAYPITGIGSSVATVIEIYLKRNAKSTNFQKGQLTKFNFLINDQFPLTISPTCGSFEAGKKGQRVLVTFTPELSKDSVNAHFPIFLKQKFIENREHIESEWRAIVELLLNQPKPEKSDTKGAIKTRQPAKSGKAGKGNRKGGDNKRKKEVKEVIEKRKSIQQLGPVDVRTLDDLQIIFSDGRVQIPSNQTLELKKRREFLNQALESTLNPLPTCGDLDYEKTWRDLLINSKPESNFYSIPCQLTLPDGREEILLLSVKCPSQRPDLVALGSRLISFGQVAIGQRQIREVHLYNTSIGKVDVEMDALNPFGPFSRVNSLRSLAPNVVFTLRLKFMPEQDRLYREHVVIIGGDSHIFLTLQGEGTTTALDLVSNSEK